MYAKIEPFLDYSVRGLCRKPYHNHPKGCPNWGKDKCPPGLPKLEDYFEMNDPFYIIWNKFDIGEHIEKMSAKHPDWTDYQKRCVLYWQGTARVQLKKEIEKFKKDHPECDVSTSPEAMGVNITETMKKIGIELEWPPRKYAYQIAIGGTKKLIRSFEKFVYEGIKWYNNGELGEEEKEPEPTTSIPKEKWGVHLSHCCPKHGCKYGDVDCPVKLGIIVPNWVKSNAYMNPCPYCYGEYWR